MHKDIAKLKENFFSFNIPLILLIIVSLFFLFINLIWSQCNFSFGYWCQGNENFMGVVQLNTFFKKLFISSQLKEIIWGQYGHANSYPSLYFIWQAMVSHVANTLNYATLIFGNYLLFLLTTIFIYKIAITIKDRKTGLVSVLLFSIYPGVYGSSRFCMVENALIPIVTIAIYFLIKSQNFLNIRYCILLGLSLGLGLLTKQHFILFVVGGICYEFFLAIFNRRINVEPENYKKFLNIIIILILSILISLPFYLRVFKYQMHLFYEYKYQYFLATGPEYVKSGALVSWLYYLFILINAQLSLPLFIIFLVSFSWIIVFTKKNRVLPHLMIWILFPYFILQMFNVKWNKYSLPYLPACALISGLAISQIKVKRYLINSLVVIIFIFGIAQNVFFSFFDIHQSPLIKNRFLKAPYNRDTDWNIYFFVHANAVVKPDYIRRINCQRLIATIDNYLSNKGKADIWFFTKVKEAANNENADLSSYLELHCLLKGYGFSKYNFKEDDEIHTILNSRHNDSSVVILKLPDGFVFTEEQTNHFLKYIIQNDKGGLSLVAKKLIFNLNFQENYCINPGIYYLVVFKQDNL